MEKYTDVQRLKLEKEKEKRKKGERGRERERKRWRRNEESSTNFWNIFGEEISGIRRCNVPRILGGNLWILDEVSVALRKGTRDIITTLKCGEREREGNGDGMG